MKLILEAIKALFREIKASRTHYDERRTVDTPPVTVAGNTVRWGYVKVADSIDFDINSITHITRSGSDGFQVNNKPVTLYKWGRGSVDICVRDPFAEDMYWAAYLPTQQAADDWWDDPEIENPFTPGLYMWVESGSDDNPEAIGVPVEVTYSFKYATGELKKLDEKYLPDKVVAEIAKIGKVEELAGDAAETASVALSKALGIQPDVILSARVSDSIAYVSGSVNLVNGRIYVVVPTSSSTSNSATSRISINGRTYYIKCGITRHGWVSKSDAVAAQNAFVANAPLVLLYSASNNAFYEITRFAATYLEVGSTQDYEDKVPEYYYGVSGHNMCSKYKYMRVQSSTEGSSKLFDIQVDDEGKLQTVDMDGNVVPAGGEVEIPTTLPNPHKLTFSGAVNAEYDGSEAVEVVIPQGGGGGSGGGNLSIHTAELTMAENVKEFVLPLPCEANKLFQLSAVLLIPSYDGNTSDKFNLYVNTGVGNINLTNVPKAGSINMYGLRYGERTRIAAATRTDAYYEHCVPNIAGQPAGAAVFDDVKWLKFVVGNTDNVFPVGTKLMFWGMYSL